MFLGHLSCKRNGMLNRSVLIVARQKLFDKTGIGLILQGYFLYPSLKAVGEDNHSDVRSTGDRH